MTTDIKGVNVKPTHHALLKVLKHLKQTDDKTLFRFKLMGLLFRTINVIALEGKSKEVFDRYVQHRAKVMESLQTLDGLDVIELLDKPLRVFLESSKVMQYCNGELDEISPTALLQEVLETPNKEIDQLMLDVLKNYDSDGDLIPTGVDWVSDTIPHELDSDGDKVYTLEITPPEDDFAGDTLVIEGKHKSYIRNLELFIKYYSKALNAERIDQGEMLTHRSGLLHEISCLPKPMPSHLVDLEQALKDVDTPVALLTALRSWRDRREAEESQGESLDRFEVVDFTETLYNEFISVLDIFLKNYAKRLEAGEIDQVEMLVHRNHIRIALSRLPHPLPSHLVDLIKELDTVGTPEGLLAVLTRWQSMRTSERANKDYWGGMKVTNPNEGEISQDLSALMRTVNERRFKSFEQARPDLHAKEIVETLNNSLSDLISTLKDNATSSQTDPKEKPSLAKVIELKPKKD